MAVADRTIQILPGGQSSAPFTYTVPSSTSFALLAVRAVFDGTGAAGAFLPAIQLVSDAGVLMAQTIGTSVAVGGSADATFAPFLEGAATGTSGGADLQNTVIAAGAIAIWKLDEMSGTVAHDSSGNGFDLAATPNPPVWGQSIGPPGTTSARWMSDSSKREVLGTFPALGTAAQPFSVFGWMQYTDNDPANGYYLLGQGDTATLAFGVGWALTVNGGVLANPKKLQLYSNDTSHAGGERINSDAQLSQNTWYHIAATWNGTTWKLYVNGLLQAATDNRAWTPTLGVIMGSEGTSGGALAFHMDGLMSWWEVVMGTALTSTQFLAIMASVP